MIIGIIVTSIHLLIPIKEVHKPQPVILDITREGVAPPEVITLPEIKPLKIGPPIETACITPVEYESKEPNTDWACAYVTNLQYSMSPGFKGCDGNISYEATSETEFKVHKDDGGKEFLTIH